MIRPGWKASPKGSQWILGINERNRKMVHAINPRRHFPLARDKVLTKRVLEGARIPIPETLLIFRGIHEARNVDELIGDRSDFVIKPARGSQGNGIAILVARRENGWSDHGGRIWRPRDLARHIGNIIFGHYAGGMEDVAIAEERLVAAELLPGARFPGLFDIRVITLRGAPIMAMLRIPTRASRGRANLHQGAIGVGVDLETGITTTGWWKGRPVDEHPDSGDRLAEVRVHQWKDVVDTAIRAASAFPLGYLGIDLTIDATRGPVVLEVNTRPGLEIQNVNRRGLRPLVGLCPPEVRA